MTADKWLLKIFKDREFAYSVAFRTRKEAAEYCNSMHSVRLSFELVKL